MILLGYKPVCLASISNVNNYKFFLLAKLCYYIAVIRFNVDDIAACTCAYNVLAVHYK